ncbi:MAG: hypothetical protein COX44_01840 [Candidatus Portnoybacteria bacterium CG23_combo_of_CG06-09_8_20_14_all_37_13]|uniref:HicB-like antitoxin of toxin-antitoxin system domain-containing protein n=1 Tax=Candidatus Portnoybacteria bacterium CG23_combo_of_CG06-09_8_20_14_all_37_13 TaxID=1974819 RepID=A0A2G9YD22_9BACT|nr:MAG: hypothetical protein COX44_01840 [Candidatus Portnoybacteria bacterium CG23_combo_of_CG06-09_8_20_14_all_37_13]
MRNYNFKVLIRKDNNGYFVASVPALPGCHTQAKTYEELLLRIKEAIELCLEVSEKDRDYKENLAYLHQPSFFGIEDVSIRA